MYRENREKAVRSVLNEESPRCDVSPAALAAHFAPQGAPEVQGARPAEAADLPRAPESPALELPITADEVSSRLQRAANTAPGPDGLRYAAWRALDPNCLLLREVFELCRQAQRVPASWKASETVLLHKGGEPELAASWRPIALGLTVAKLYAGVWADRLSAWAETNDLLSPCQKGFRSFDGVLEHNYVLQCAINAARRSREGCQVAFVDLTNAFGSVPHHHIWRVLRDLGLPDAPLASIIDLYQGATTCFRTAGGVSDPVPTTRGVRQGCPLSGLLFNLSMEPLLRTLSQADILCLAFADDLALVLPSAAAVRPALELLERCLVWCGLTPNPQKSALLSVVQGPPQDATLAGARLPTIDQGASYRYLGRPVGHTRLSSPPLTVLEDARRDALLLLDSALAPWQKLDAIRTFIVPRLTHCLRLGVLPKGPLQSFDKALRWRVKGILNLPANATNAYLYAPTSAGGVGLTELRREADVLLVASSSQLLNSRDPEVARVARAELARVAARRLDHDRDPTPADLASYLNGVELRDGGDVSSRFTRTRVSTKALAASIALDWRPADDTPTLFVGIKPVERRREAGQVRDALRQRELADLVARPHQGKVMSCVAAEPVSSHYMYNGSYTRFAEWRFVHRARLGLVPLNGYQQRRPAADQRCRRCNHPRETLPHVLNHCRPHMVALTKRHDAILTRLERAVPKDRGTAVRVNRQVPGVNSPLRPDLVVISGDTVTICDVTVAFENRPEALRAAAAAKEAKYADIARRLREQGKTASVHALVLGSLGTWYRGNENTLRQLRVSRFYARLMRKLMVSDTLRWSRDVYVEHVSGRRQYE